jgi:threonine synthase
MVRAFEQQAERATPWEGAYTAADGLRVPRAVGDRLILAALRESHGTALAVSDDELLAAALDLSRATGIGAAPEGGACLAAVRRLRANGWIGEDERVVLFNTGGPLKYLDCWGWK